MYRENQLGMAVRKYLILAGFLIISYFEAGVAIMWRTALAELFKCGEAFAMSWRNVIHFEASLAETRRNCNHQKSKR